MGWTALYIIIFSILGGIPLVWSVVNLRRGTSAAVAMIGLVFAMFLLFFTFGYLSRGGACPIGNQPTGTSAGAITCVPPPSPTSSPCEPDVWIAECQKKIVGPHCPAPLPKAAPLPANTFCPKGQTPVFDFCEHMQPGNIKQPWAFWSDLSFIAAGLWLFWLFQYYDRMRDSGRFRLGQLIIPLTADNPMVEIGFLSITYGLIVIFMGPPSMWYHAWIRDWAGWFDTMSVVIWLMFNAAYVWVTICGPMWGKMRGVGRTITVLCIWGGFLVTFGPIAAKHQSFRLILYFIAGGSWGLGELVYLIAGAASSKATFRRNNWLFLANFLVLVITMTIWLFWNPGVSLFTSAQACQARESFPGHATFHILASLSTLLTFFSFASERSKPVNSDRNWLNPFRRG